MEKVKEVDVPIALDDAYFLLGLLEYCKESIHIKSTSIARIGTIQEKIRLGIMSEGAKIYE